jgi:hypothetical protein
MNIAVNVLVIGVACFAAYLVYVVAERAMKNFSPLNSRRVIPFAVALLTLLSIVELGRGIILLLLIPYAALGITLVVLYSMRLLAAKTKGKKFSMAKYWPRSLHTVCRAYMRRIREEGIDLRRR